MANNNAKRGSYFKARTRKWLLAEGWQVADMEIVKTIYPHGFAASKSFAVKKDQFGSDLLAMHPMHGFRFIQVKGGKQAAGHSTFPAARREFGKFKFPLHCLHCRRWVVAWAPRAREPRVVEC